MMGTLGLCSLRRRDANLEEEFYYGDVQNPEDVICEGSDVEESEGETIEKRRRYEHHARRYMDGHLPLLQSATLRGPFSRETGWINPWRHQPRTEQDWWKPESEDMLFTRANVMKMATENGLGYLNPAEALAWCKTTAQAAAKSISDWEEGNGAQDLTVEALPHEDNLRVDETNEPNSTRAIMGESQTAGLPESDQIYSQYDIPMTDLCRNTPTQSGLAPNTSPRGMKRPADYHWLKGTTVFKLARTESPSQPSPTPMPGARGEPGARWKQKASTSKLSSQGQYHSMSCQDADFGNKLPRKESNSSLVRGFQGIEASTDAVSSINGAKATPVCLDNDNTLSIINPGSTNDSQSDRRLYESQALGVHSKPSQINTDDVLSAKLYDPTSRFYSSYPADESLNTSSLPFAQGRMTPNAHNSSTATPVSIVSGLPTLPRQAEIPCRSSKIETSSAEEDSFVTEIAPSSGVLEKFHYRKKRTVIPVRSFISKPLRRGTTPGPTSEVSHIRSATQDRQGQPDLSKQASSGDAIKSSAFQPNSGRSNDKLSRYNQSLQTSNQLLPTDHLKPSAGATTESSKIIHEDLHPEATVSMLAADRIINGAELLPQYKQSQAQSLARESQINPTTPSPSNNRLTTYQQPGESSATEAVPKRTLSRGSPHIAERSVSLETPRLEMTLAESVQTASAVVATLSSQETNCQRLNDASQTSTYRPVIGTQSPWMPSFLSTFPAAPDGREFDTSSASALREEKLPKEQKSLSARGGGWDDAAPNSIELPKTPDMNTIVPFKELMSPIPLIHLESPDSPFDDLLDTQVLLAATTKNPWTETSARKSSIKPRKRVSFCGLTSSQDKASEGKAARLILRSPSPSPEPNPQIEEEMSRDTPMPNVNLKQHLSTLETFKLTSQKKHETPLRSSPAIGAMAEAFIQADQEVEVERRGQSRFARSPSRHLKPLNDADSNIGMDSITSEGLEYSARPSSPNRSARTGRIDLYDIGDNMDSIFDDVVGDVLEEWSVDAALKKVKASEGVEIRRRPAAGIA